VPNGLLSLAAHNGNIGRAFGLLAGLKANVKSGDDPKCQALDDRSAVSGAPSGARYFVAPRVSRARSIGEHQKSDRDPPCDRARHHQAYGPD